MSGERREAITPQQLPFLYPLQVTALNFTTNGEIHVLRDTVKEWRRFQEHWLELWTVLEYNWKKSAHIHDDDHSRSCMKNSLLQANFREKLHPYKLQTPDKLFCKYGYYMQLSQEEIGKSDSLRYTFLSV